MDAELRQQIDEWKNRKTAYKENPEWRPEPGIKTSVLLKSIPNYTQKLKTFINDPSNPTLVEKFLKNYRISYLTECNLGEDTGTKIEEETEMAVSSSEPLTRTFQKTRNLNNALSFVFGNSLLMDRLDHKFDTNLAKEINRLVGEGIFDNPGMYRTCDSWPAGSYEVPRQKGAAKTSRPFDASPCDDYYTSPRMIESKMEELFAEFKEHRQIIEHNDLWYSRASEFLARFLEIHPFINGNGRTARLLLSYLLIKYSTVPVSLFSPMRETQGNTVYVTCIKLAHPKDEYYTDYRTLNTLIIESCHNSVLKCISEFDLLFS